MAFRDLSLIALSGIVLLVAACGATSQPTTPELAVTIPVKHLRNNDLRALVLNGLSADRRRELEADWQQKVAQSDPQEAAQVDIFITQLTADGGVDALMTTYIEPQLAEVDPEQIATWVQLMGAMAMSSGGEADEQEMQEAQKFLVKLAEHLRSCGLNDPAKARRALQALADGLKASGIKRMQELQKLTLEQGLARFGPIFGGFKGALAVYGFDLDRILDSVRVDEVSGEGATRQVTVSLTVLGERTSFPVPVEQQGELWAVAD